MQQFEALHFRPTKEESPHRIEQFDLFFQIDQGWSPHLIQESKYLFLRLSYLAFLWFLESSNMEFAKKARCNGATFMKLGRAPTIFSTFIFDSFSHTLKLFDNFIILEVIYCFGKLVLNTK